MKRTISYTAGLAVGGIFVYAGILKALDPAQFAAGIANYKLLPWSAGVVLALYLPWLEILCGVALIVRRLHVAAALILSALCGTFLIALVSAKARGLDIACGCFGHSGSGHLLRSLLIDAAILCALIFLFATEARKSNAQCDNGS
jgi:putative oxidoreductase